MPMRITGMNSGMDTESIISELVSVRSKQKDNMVKAQKKLEWKMDGWKTLNSKIYGLYSSTISDMRFSSTYASKKTTVSNPKVATVMASANAPDGVQTMKVNSMARSGYLTGESLKDADGNKTNYTANTKLSDIAGMTADSSGAINLSITTGGKTTDINLTGDSTVGDLVKQLKNAGVNASFDENYQRFFISSKTTGKDADFSLTAGNDNGFNALSALGINVLNSETQKSYEKLANMSAADQASYIENKTKELTDAAQKQLDAANKTIEEKTKAIDEFFEKNEDPTFVKSDMDSLDKITQAKDAITAYRDSLKEAPEGESEEDKKTREENLKKANEQLTSLNKLEGYYKDLDSANASKAEAEGKLANDSQAIRDSVTADLASKIAKAQDVVSGNASGFSTGATRIEGKDASITLNGATFESGTNTFSINGLTITAMSESDEEVTLSTQDDYDGVYDTIKKFIKGYNELVNEMDKLYNADSSKGYEPLTADEKKEMSDNEVEEWEKKIKDSLFRKDSTLGEINNALQDAMAKGFNINGKTMHLSDFGIGTLGYFNSAENERHAYHIDGDKEDMFTGSNTDKLKNMIANDPQTVTKFFQELSNSLYTTLTEKMSGTSLRTTYKVYNDKQMTADLADYKTKIAKEEERIKAYEDKWYDKFGAMETAMAKLNAKTSAISGLLGM